MEVTPTRRIRQIAGRRSVEREGKGATRGTVGEGNPLDFIRQGGCDIIVRHRDGQITSSQIRRIDGQRGNIQGPQATGCVEGHGACSASAAADRHLIDGRERFQGRLDCAGCSIIGQRYCGRAIEAQCIGAPAGRRIETKGLDFVRSLNRGNEVIDDE